jgi:hypothetical protein
MNRFGAELKRKSVKTNNHPIGASAKIDIRRRVLGVIPNPRVMDAFAGSGKMHREVWHVAAGGYVACDKKWYRDQREAYVADNCRLLRAIDLNAFNIFDLDAYGSPWEQAIIVADRRRVSPGELIGLTMTDGSGLKLKLGGMPSALVEIAGFSAIPVGAFRQQNDILERAIIGLSRRMRCTVIDRWEAHGKTGAQVVYLGLVLRGLPQ